jgi:hypothetical protein
MHGLEGNVRFRTRLYSENLERSSFAGAWMSAFDWLLVGHLVGDFLLQTNEMARRKSQSWAWLLRHLAVYMAVLTVVLGALAWTHGVPLWVVGFVWLLIGVTHAILDRRGFTRWWMRIVGIPPDILWLQIAVDQVFHIVVLAAAAQLLLWTSN